MARVLYCEYCTGDTVFGTGELVLYWEPGNWAFRDWGIITLLGIAEFGIPGLRILYWGYSIGTGESVLSWEPRNWAFRDLGIITLLGLAEFSIPGLQITDLGIPSLQGGNYGLPPPSPLSNFPYLRALCPGGTAHADEKIREGGRGRGEGHRGKKLPILYPQYSIRSRGPWP